MKRFSVREGLEFIRLAQWADPRWRFAIMQGPDGGKRWLIGCRCDVTMPITNLDKCKFETLDDAFRAFLRSDLWKIFAWQCGAGDQNHFKTAEERTAQLIDRLPRLDYPDRSE